MIAKKKWNPVSMAIDECLGNSCCSRNGSCLPRGKKANHQKYQQIYQEPVATETTATAASIITDLARLIAYSNAVASLGIGVISTPEEFVHCLTIACWPKSRKAWQGNEKHLYRISVKQFNEAARLRHPILYSRQQRPSGTDQPWWHPLRLPITRLCISNVEDYILSGFGVRRELDDQRSSTLFRLSIKAFYIYIYIYIYIYMQIHSRSRRAWNCSVLWKFWADWVKFDTDCFTTMFHEGRWTPP